MSLRQKGFDIYSWTVKTNMRSQLDYVLRYAPVEVNITLPFIKFIIN